MPVPATTGQLRTRVQDLQIGDYIACNVRTNRPTDGNSNVLIGQLGTTNPMECMVDQTKVYGGATPKTEKFYLVKVDTGLLIADRVVQSNISFNNRLGHRLIDGQWLNCLIYTDATDNGGDLYRSLQRNTPVTLNTYMSYVWETVARYIQWDYLYPKTLEKFILSTMTVTGGYEPLKGFDIIASNDNFATHQVIFSGQNLTPGAETTYDIPDAGKFLSFRLMLKEFYPYNAGDGQCLSRAIPVTKEEVKPLILRSMSGGVYWAGENGELSTSDKGKGSFPTINEFDKYITGFPKELIRGGSGLDDVFHCNSSKTGRGTMSRDISASSWAYFVDRYLAQPEDVPKMSFIGMTGVTSSGFRPVIEYEEEI